MRFKYIGFLLLVLILPEKIIFGSELKGVGIKYVYVSYPLSPKFSYFSMSWVGIGEKMMNDIYGITKERPIFDESIPPARNKMAKCQFRLHTEDEINYKISYSVELIPENKVVLSGDGEGFKLGDDMGMSIKSAIDDVAQLINSEWLNENK